MIDPLFILIGYTAILFLIFCFYLKNMQTFGIAGFTLLFYGVSALTSIYFYQNSFTEVSNIQVTPFLFIITCLLISLWPFIKNAQEIKFIGLAQYEDSNNFIYLFLIISTPLLLWSAMELSYLAIHTDTSVLVDIYNDRQEMRPKFSNVGHICVGYVRLLNFIWPILFFYCISKGGKYKILAYVAALGTVCMCLDQYVGASRAAIVKQIIHFVSVYFLCENTLPNSFKRKLTLFGGCVLGLLVFFLLAITISRFNAVNGNNDILTWLSLYSGEGVLRYSQYVWDLDQISYGDTNFSFIKSCLGLDTFTDNDIRREYYATKFNIPTHIFYTYIGDLTIDLGKPFTLFFLIALASMINLIIRKSINRGYFSFTSFYLLSVYILMIIYGIMYFFCKIYIVEMRVFVDFILIGLMQRFLYNPVEQNEVI